MASYPNQGSSPYGDQLRAYIDEGDARSLSAKIAAEKAVVDAENAITEAQQAQSGAEAARETANSSATAASDSASSAASSASGAAASATEAQGYRDQAVQIVIADADQAMAAAINEPGSATETALAASQARATRTVSEAGFTLGDSMTEDALSTASPTWPIGIGIDLGVTVTNGGVGGQAPGDIMVRSGSYDPTITFPGNVLPTGTSPVAVTMEAVGWRADSTYSYTFPGDVLLADGTTIPGTLVSSTATQSFTFARTSPGAALDTTGARFHSNGADAYRDRWWIVGIGTNSPVGGPLGSDHAFLPTAADRIARRLYAGNDRVLFWGPVPSPSEIRGSAGYKGADRAATLLLRRYGDALVDPLGRFVDVWRWMLTRGLLVAGITPTAQDKTDIANGIIPKSLQETGGGVHFNATGSGLVRALFREVIKGKGWVTGTSPQPADLARPTGLSSTAQTSNSITWQWNEVPDAVAYQIRYRLAGTSDPWKYAYTLTAGTTTKNLAVPDLNNGSSYEAQVSAANVLYDSAEWSALATAATTGAPPIVLASEGFSGAPTTNINGRSSDNYAGGTTFAWSSSGGGLGIDADNRLYNSDGIANKNAQFTVPGSPADYAVEFEMPVLPETANVLVYIRRTDGNNNAWINLGASGVGSLNKRVASVTTSNIAYFNFAAGQRIKFKASGSTLTVDVDGTQVLTHSLGADLPTGPIVYVQINAQYNARVDNLRVLDK